VSVPKQNDLLRQVVLFWRKSTTDLKKLNAARMSAAGEGLTEPNHNFLPFEKKM